ncbi:hypothetical protein [Effusibacillus lacus]|nr:hypothetical protein [Effusibacillus lacus]TCS74655.1 hypothetical protein EDD64_112105 [Effusibacillus lacus]
MKLTKYLPFILIALFCITVQTFMLTRQQFLPFPEPFGRESKLPPASVKQSVQPVDSNQFAYKSGAAITYVTLDEHGNSQVFNRPLPDQDMLYPRWAKERAYWIGSDNHLYGSPWSQDKWGPRQMIVKQQVTAFDVVDRKSQFPLLVWSNNDSVEVGQLMEQGAESIASLPIAGVTNLKAIPDRQGKLSIGVWAKGSDSYEIWYAQADPASGKMERILKAKTVRLSDYSKFHDFDAGLDSTSFYLFYAIESTKTSKVTLTYVSIPLHTFSPVSEGKVSVSLADGKTTTDVYGAYVFPQQSDRLQLALVSSFVKDRFDHLEPYLITFENGTPVSQALVSGMRGIPMEPVYAKNDLGHTQVLWLSLNGRSYDVFYTTDSPNYRERMNVLSKEDYIWSLKALPLLIGISLVAVLITFKWFPLSYAYLLAVLFFREHHFMAKARVHFWIATGLYLIMKILFIGDFYKPHAVKLMPAYMTQWYSPYILTGMIFLISYLSTRLWRKRLEDRHPLMEFSYFVLVDVFATTLWYSYFLSTVIL